MTQDPAGAAGCWSCGAAATARRIAVETLIRGREAAAGGPYRVFRCTSCGVENGVLEDARGRRMLYPLSGLSEPSILDHLLSRAEQARLGRSRAWWRRNREHVDRFRRGAPELLRDGPIPPPKRAPPRTARRQPGPRAPGAGPPRSSPRPAPHGPAGRPVGRVPAVSGPLAVLGVPDDAPADEIRRAFRRLAKRLHPDRAARSGLAPDEAAARFRAVREAYEELIAGSRRT